MARTADPLVVNIVRRAQTIEMNSDAGSIQIANEGGDFPSGSHSDFAAWYFLPVAMRLRRDLHIAGCGTPHTTANARRMSQIWESWVPGHLHAVSVSFSRETPRAPISTLNRLIFVSGGLDAAFTALKMRGSKHSQDSVTIQGMDYSLTDEPRFAALLHKTQVIASMVSRRRHVVQSNAYRLYDALQLNLKRHHLSHIFSLAGAGFSFATDYNELILAADDRLDAQFLTFPWGSNSATNSLFSDGVTHLVSDADDVSRPEKIIEISGSPEALSSLSFCWNRNSQPMNCGTCEKCLRTKLLFLAATGQFPEIFASDDIPTDWAKRLKYKLPAGFQAIQEILHTAASFGNERYIKNFDLTRKMVTDFYTSNPYRRWDLPGTQTGYRKAISKRLRKMFGER